MCRVYFNVLVLLCTFVTCSTKPTIGHVKGVDVTDYPRDLYGYGPNPPNPLWPNNSRIAVSFVVNYEEGGEYSILHGDETSEYVLSERVYTDPVVGGRSPNIESVYEYGARVGIWRLLRIFREEDVKFTSWAVGMALERNPEVAQVMAAEGHEIATHHYRWIDWTNVPYEEEKALLERAIDVQEQLTGTRPLGHYVGRVTSANAFQIAVEEGGFQYYSDRYNDDLPYWDYTFEVPQLIIPYSYDCNDARFSWDNNFGSGEDFFQYLKATFDMLYEEGVTSPKMMSIGLHCRIVGRPGRAKALQDFIRYVKSHDQVWIPRRIEISNHWRQFHPPNTDENVRQNKD